MPYPLLAENLAHAGGIAHGFFTRHGGVSTGIYTSLNCGIGSKDAAAAVAENRRRVVQHLGARDLVSAYQVHGVTALTVSAGWPGEARPRADAMVTATRGLALGVLTADCAPVLFADPHAGVVGAAHAGWRGALAGILEAAIAAMEGLGAERARIQAAVGPCIGQVAYEVGPEFEAKFLSQDSANARFFSRTDPNARPHFDLSAYVRRRLEAAGTAEASTIGECTSEGSDQFFSYRGSQARREADYGRQISAIVLT
jgi:YfiH family protein